MTVEEERFLKEAVKLIGAIDESLKECYYKGEFTLEEYNENQKIVNLIYIVYNRIAEVKSNYLLRSYLRVKGIKLQDNNIYKEFYDNIKAVHKSIKDKRFKALRDRYIRYSQVGIPVKCICCGKKQKYQGGGTVVKSSEDLPFIENGIGRWICSEKCYNEIYTAS